MEPTQLAGSERRREEREAAMRRRRASVRLGTAGLALLFASGIAIVLLPEFILPLVALMTASVVVIATAFLLVRTPMAGILRLLEK